MESAYGVRDNAAPPAIAFIKDVASLYHRNIWLFWKMLLPAAVFGYFVLFLATDRANAIFNSIPHRPELLLQHPIEIAEAALLRFGGFVADWVIYCFAFAGIAVAVDELEAEKQPTAEACFAGARERLVKFFGLSLALWFICVLAFAFWTFVTTALIVQLGKANLLRNFAVSLPLYFVPIWVLSRFGLAIPAFVLEKSSISKAFFRSDELTAGCWAILAILLLESVGGSYLVFLLIQWLVWQAANHGVAPSWIANLGLPLGLLIGFFLEPHMFIGFALLFVRRSSHSAQATATSAVGMG
jgi:hypothetical protein